MSEWKEYKVTDFSQILSGTTPSSTVEEYWNGGIVWITPVDLSKTTSRYIKTSERKITRKGLASSSIKMIPAYSIVMSSRAPIGYFAIVTNPYTTNQGCKSFVLFEEQDADFHYYNFLFNKNKFLNLGSGSTFQEISKSSIQKLSFTIPASLSEQRSIAAVLTTIDEAIEATEKIIAKRRRVKEGLMQDLFRYGLDDQGQLRSESTHRFKDSPLGRIPEEWDYQKAIKKLYMKGRIGWQGLKKDEFMEDGNYLVTGIHFNNKNRVDWEKCFRISDYRYNQAPEIQLKLNDVLITKDGTIGKVALIDYLPGNASLNSHLLVLRPLYNNINPVFLYYQLLTYRFRVFIDNIKTGSTLAGLSQSNFGKFDLLLPSLPEQSRIVAVLSAADEAIEKEEAVLEKLKAQKRGLMEDLLTGKVRVTPEMMEEYANGDKL